MDKKIYIIGLLVDELRNEVTEKDFANDKLKYLEKERKTIEGYALRDAAEIDRLREVVGNRNNREAEFEKEIAELKKKRAKGMLSADIVMKDLFGDGYKYAGMDALRKNIKEKMDRHEKAKEETAELKKDRDAWKSVSEGKLLGVLDENKELKEEIATRGSLYPKVSF